MTEPAGRSLRLRAATPLLVLGVVGVALAADLRASPAAVGHPILPLWILALGIGIIALGGGAVLLIAPSPTPSAPLPPEPDVVVVPRSEWERLVSRVRALATADARGAGEPPSPPSWTTPGAPAGRPMAVDPPVEEPTPTPSVPPTSFAPAPAAAGPPSRPRPMIEGPSCATCGRTVPARAAWRGCVVCHRPLCTDCLTASVRERGASYCASCAATA